jgi:heme oxygenase
MAARVLMRLNVETRIHHADVDATWHALLTLDVTRRRYGDQLIRVYGFEAAVEGLLAYVAGLDYRDRVRSGFLVEDLLVLGYLPETIAQLPQCDVSAPFRDLAHALGWQYTIERATVVHEQLRRHLVQRIPELSRACSYLAAGETGGAKRWRAYGELLAREVTSPELEAHVIEAAHEALRCQSDWYRSPRAR